MNPELFQSLVLFVYSVLFFSIALIMWRKKRKRSHALGNHFPCATYLRMRFETARILDTKEHSQSRIGALRLAISDIIQDELEGGFLAHENETIKRMHRSLQMEIQSIYNTLIEKFEATEERERKLRTAMIFEANGRLVRHPYDLIGIRRQKLFEDSLKACLEVENGRTSIVSTELVKTRLYQCCNKEGVQNQIFVALKIVATIIVVTFAVTVNDYVQDIKVIKLFLNSGNLLAGIDGQYRDYSWAKGVIPAAKFLIAVMVFSSLHIVLNLPSLWYRFKVAQQMVSPRAELEFETISPTHVINQYNLPISESRNESTLQMMVQWGVYLCYSWFITWLIELSEDNEELQQVSNILSFSRMYPSMISSIFSLTYGQYLAHLVCYKYRTSRKQQITYFLSSAMITLCVTSILLTLQTALLDWTRVARSIISIYRVAVLLMTPLLYNYMVLPTSNNKFQTVSMDTPSFFHDMMMQCFVFSFYIGQAALIDFFLYISHHLELGRTLPQLAFDISGNETFLAVKPDDLTPSISYIGDPVNNRMAFIIISSVAIPVTWTCAYVGLYLYFKDMTSFIQFHPQNKPPQDNEYWKEKLKRVLSVQNLTTKLKSFLYEKPNLKGKWMDLSISNDRQTTNASDVDNFIPETTLLDKTTLNDIRSSFYCWKKEP